MLDCFDETKLNKGNDMEIKITENRLKEIIKEAINEVLNNKNEILFDLDKISIDFLKKQYVDFRFNSVPDHFGSPLLKNDDGQYLIENENESTPLEEVKKIISTKYLLKDKQFIITKNANEIYIALLIPNIGENIKLLEDDMKQLGYFIGTVRNIKILNMDWVQLQFEPLYQKDETESMTEKPYLFHITPNYNLDSIKKNGLLPKSDNSKFNYPDRIYLIKYGISEHQIIHLAKQLCLLNKNPKNDGNYSILAINTKKLPKNIKIFLDPNYEMGCYTNDIIPFDCVDFITNINLNNLK